LRRGSETLLDAAGDATNQLKKEDMLSLKENQYRKPILASFGVLCSLRSLECTSPSVSMPFPWPGNYAYATAAITARLRPCTRHRSWPFSTEWGSGRQAPLLRACAPAVRLEHRFAFSPAALSLSVPSPMVLHLQVAFLSLRLLAQAEPSPERSVRGEAGWKVGGVQVSAKKDRK
jgi:hypothetical protein